MIFAFGWHDGIIVAIWGINFCYSEGPQISRSETRPFVVTLTVSNSPVEKERGKHRGPRTLTRPFDITKYVDGRRGGLFTTTPRKLRVYETVRTRSNCYVRFIYLLIQTVCRTSDENEHAGRFSCQWHQVRTDSIWARV